MQLEERVYAKHFNDSVPIEKAYKFAREYFEKNLLGKQFTAKDGRKIALTERGFREFFFSVQEALSGGSRGAAKVYSSRDDGDDYLSDVLALVTSLDKIILDMEFESTQGNRKPHIKPDIKKYDTYDCEVEIDKELHDCKIRIEVPHKGDNRYYFHYLD